MRTWILASIIILSGCLTPAEPRSIDPAPPPDSQESDLAFNGTGAWLYEVKATVPQECHANSSARGNASRHEPVFMTAWFDRTYKNGVVRLYDSGVDSVGTPYVAARAADHSQETDSLGFKSEWSIEGRVDGWWADGHAYLLVAVINASARDGRSGLEMKPECEHDMPRLVAVSKSFSLLDERDFTDGAHARAGASGGTRIAQASVQENYSFRAEGDFLLVGYMSGDPQKIGTIELKGPLQEEWYFLPSSYMVGAMVDQPGAMFFGARGNPGEYNASFTQAQAGPLIALSLGVFDLLPASQGHAKIP